MKVKIPECLVRFAEKTERGQRLLKSLKKIYRILVEKSLYAISVDDLIIQSVKKQFAKLGYIIKQRKGLRIKPRLLFFALKGDKNE